MSRNWRIRAAGTFVAWTCLVVMLTLIGTGPDLVLFAGAVAAAAGLLWLATDLAALVAPVTFRWQPAERVIDDGQDHRAWLIERRIATIGMRSGDRLHDDLVAIVDDRLRAHHGVDRREDPERATAICGPLVAGFLSSPDGVVRDERQLERLVRAIEAI